MQASDDERLGAATIGKSQRSRRSFKVEIGQQLEWRDVIGADRRTRDLGSEFPLDPLPQFIVVLRTGVAQPA